MAWVGADQRGPASIRIAADSRISWSSAEGKVVRKWDYGRKIFASHKHPDVVGYCGDVLFPTQTLSQVFELIDAGLFFCGTPDPEAKLSLIVESLKRASANYPSAETRDFSIVYATRVGEGLDGNFRIAVSSFSGGCLKSSSWWVIIPNTSSLLVILGSGAEKYLVHQKKWEASDIGGTSRAMFSSFSEFLRSQSDEKTGGPAQLAGLFRKCAAKSFGIVWDQKLYLLGMEVINSSESPEFACYNDLFEVCDVKTLKRHENAQRHAKPWRLK
jgi:hypothetical protein